MRNKAFIDGQNIYLSTNFHKENPWKIDHKKFRILLKEKYSVTEAYYYLGYPSQEHQSLYTNLQKSGFIVQFKSHNSNLVSNKKGNVDADIIFAIMKLLVDKDDSFDKIVLVSGDGDYKSLADYLIKKECLKKLIYPSYKNVSSYIKKLMQNIKTVWKITA